MASFQNPSVKATKKSAFSCDTCRRRKVKCGGEQPSCARCVARDDTCLYKLSPTLSYTEKLENRVKELEGIVSELQKQLAGPVASPPITSRLVPLEDNLPPGETTDAELPRTFEGLKLDDQGCVTYHGATSFFQLPTPASLERPSILSGISVRLDDDDRKKERLVNNAWQQRALETLSETPVGLQPKNVIMKTILKRSW